MCVLSILHKHEIHHRQANTLNQNFNVTTISNHQCLLLISSRILFTHNQNLQITQTIHTTLVILPAQFTASHPCCNAPASVSSSISIPLYVAIQIQSLVDVLNVSHKQSRVMVLDRYKLKLFTQNIQELILPVKLPRVSEKVALQPLLRHGEKPFTTIEPRCSRR